MPDRLVARALAQDQEIALVHAFAPFLGREALPGGGEIFEPLRDIKPVNAARSGSATTGREIVGQGWPPNLKFNEHIEADGPTVFARLQNGLEGIVSKRKGSAYRSGRSPDWLKMKNPACAAVTREAEEDWAR